MRGPWRAMVGLVIGATAIAGIIALGRLTRDKLDDQGHYTVAIADLSFPTPPGMSRAAFLDEVRYNRPIPEKLDRTNPASRLQLQQALAAHPWVESCRVGDFRDATPVSLTIREPALAVGGRVLDRQGVVLPIAASTAGLPEYRGAARPGAVASGAPHPDPAIVGVAKTVGWLRGQWPATVWASAELTPEGLVLTRADGARAVWGLGKVDEPPAEQKLARLKAWQSGTIDLRKGPSGS